MSLQKPFLSSLSLLCILLPAPLAAHGDEAGKYVGEYFSRGHEAGRNGSFMNISLGNDYTATVTEDPGTGEITTLFGHWAVAGNGVTVTFLPQEGKPAESPMNFTSGHDGLQATTWNHAVWGKESPPPMQKGGQKVKLHYWTTTNP
jgi:hypothetical protein